MAMKASKTLLLSRRSNVVSCCWRYWRHYFYFATTTSKQQQQQQQHPRRMLHANHQQHRHEATASRKIPNSIQILRQGTALMISDDAQDDDKEDKDAANAAAAAAYDADPNADRTTTTTTMRMMMMIHPFAAPWLWVHDPNFIHPTSGQKLRTLGQYSPRKHRIVDADWRLLVGRNNDATTTTTTATATTHSSSSLSSSHHHHHHHDDKMTPITPPPPPTLLLHPPPPPGSYHPRGGVYDDANGNEDADADADRLLLHVTWADNVESYYDWDWLRQFAPSTTATTSSSSSTSKNRNSTNTTTNIASSSTQITKEIAIGASMTNPLAIPIPTLDYQEVLTTDQGRWEALHGIMEHGAILIRQSPIILHHDSSSSSSSDYNNNNTDNDDANNDDEALLVPVIASDETVANMGKCLSGGRLSHGALYGDTFRVVSQPNAQNIAYTTVALPPHQDLTYYESKPFLQLLHCVSNAANGGASVLIDAMAAAEYLRTVAPDLFDTLCRVEATFVKQRPGADMVSFKPHIVTSSSTGEVVEVNWSPPFEGPPVLFGGGSSSSSSSSSSIEAMEDYVRAYQAMECLLNNDNDNDNSNHYHHRSPSSSSSMTRTQSQQQELPPPPASLSSSSSSSSPPLLISAELQNQLKVYANSYTWEYVLQPGDMLVFNNQRMCHGRRAFELLAVEHGSSSSSSWSNDRHRQEQQQQQQQHQERHLIGCYTDAMETVNAYRILLRSRKQRGLLQQQQQQQQQTGMRNIGNGTRASPI